MIFTANIILSKHLMKKGFKFIQNGNVPYLYFTHLDKKRQIKFNRVSNEIIFMSSKGVVLKTCKAVSEKELDNFIRVGTI